MSFLIRWGQAEIRAETAEEAYELLRRLQSSAAPPVPPAQIPAFLPVGVGQAVVPFAAFIAPRDFMGRLRMHRPDQASVLECLRACGDTCLLHLRQRTGIEAARLGGVIAALRQSLRQEGYEPDEVFACYRPHENTKDPAQVRYVPGPRLPELFGGSGQDR